jgi:hypothetical protein
MPHCYKIRAGALTKPHRGGSMPIQSRTRPALLTGLLFGLLSASGAVYAEDAPATAAPAAAPTQVRVTTNMGEFVIEVRADRAPLTAANFLRYVREGFYNGTLFHRVVANFGSGGA